MVDYQIYSRGASAVEVGQGDVCWAAGTPNSYFFDHSDVVGLEFFGQRISQHIVALLRLIMFAAH